MNVLISSFVHWWNAEAAYAAVLAEELQRAGHRVWVLTRAGTRNERQLVARGLPVRTEFPLSATNPFRLWRALVDLRRFQAREGIELVDVFHARELPLHVLAARGEPRVRVVRTRGSAQPAKGHWLNRRLHAEGCDAVVASAEVVRAQMLEALELSPEAVRTIYYPVDLPPLPGPEERAAARERLCVELGLPPQALLLAVVGRIAPEKGQGLLLEALRAVRERHPDAALLVLNKAYPEEHGRKARLEAQAESLGLGGRVRFLGFREDVRVLMALADIGVIPSLSSETNCRVAVEFFSAGTPVVAFPTGALPEVVEDGVTGRVTAARSAAALAEALTALAADPDLRGHLGAAARHAAETRFSRERFLDETLAVFEGALARP